jgi:hypothetical protein
LSCDKEIGNKSIIVRKLCSLSQNFFQKIPTFFQKPLDKSTIIVYNIPRYPKTAGFRKSVPLSCRGRRQFNPSGVLRPFFAQSFGTDGESFLFSLVFSVHDWEVKPNAQQFYSGTEEADRR